MSQLPAHPQARDKANKLLLKEAEKDVNNNFRVLDLLKPRINDRFERFQKILKERDARRVAHSENRASATYASRQASLDQRKTQRLQGHENQELAVKIAQKEISRRAANREAALTSGSDGDDLSRRLQEIRARVEGKGQNEGDRSAREKTASYHYPSVPSHHTHTSQSHLAPERQPFTEIYKPSSPLPPTVPPKESGPASTLPPPPRPDKVTSGPPARSATPELTQIFAPAAYLENGTPLRTVFLPPTLRTTFLRVAHKNTLANLETCGFLAGTLIANAFFISRLIIPSQTATSDTCEMTNESQLFDYVDTEDLMILGWIHTHPSQTCFMSSRDLHTHAGYQVMLAESVAIVCAPNKGDTYHGGDWGVYRLTDPPGKKAILSCEKPGIFHPHDVDNIYTDAMRPGHVVEAKGMEFEMVDLREQ